MNAISNGLIIGNTARVRIEQDEDARLPKNIDYTIQVPTDHDVLTPTLPAFEIIKYSRL